MRSGSRVAGWIAVAVVLSCASCGGGNSTGPGSEEAGPESDGGSDGTTTGPDAGSDATSNDATTPTDGKAPQDGSTGNEGSAATDTGAGADSSESEAGLDSASGTEGGGLDAAGDSGAPPDSGGGTITFGQGCGGTPTRLTGTVYAPNGVDPIPRVRVYAAIQINPYPSNYCDKCSAPIDPAYVSTTTAANGTFTLDLDNVPQSATIDFAIQIGRFRRHTNLPITACTTTPVTGAPVTLPGSTVAGVTDIPRIAVSAGNVDHLDAVLTALGITEYDCYEGRASVTGATATCNTLTAVTTGKTIADVLEDPTLAGPYHMMFLSCAPGAYAKFAPTHLQMSSTLQSWASGGGRVMVTDTAYDYIGQAFPAAITWAGPAGTPQPIDGANEGCAPGTNPHATTYTTTIDDMTLAAWLQVVGIIPTPPPSPATVQIQGYYQPWSLISSLSTGTTLVADATMPVDPTYGTTMCSTASTKMTDVPLTATFDVATCGRVEFSSYHTYAGAGASATAANEKIMEYEIFAAAVCSP